MAKTSFRIFRACAILFILPREGARVKPSARFFCRGVPDGGIFSEKGRFGGRDGGKTDCARLPNGVLFFCGRMPIEKRMAL
jgi:hypothetical protein